MKYKYKMISVIAGWYGMFVVILILVLTPDKPQPKASDQYYLNPHATVDAETYVSQREPYWRYDEWSLADALDTYEWLNQEDITHPWYIIYHDTAIRKAYVIFSRPRVSTAVKFKPPHIQTPSTFTGTVLIRVNYAPINDDFGVYAYAGKMTGIEGKVNCRDGLNPAEIFLLDSCEYRQFESTFTIRPNTK